MSLLPFLPQAHAEIALSEGVVLSRARFLREVAALAAMLPPRGYMLNHCADHYRFAVALAAAMLRGQVSLFPANSAAETLRQLQAQYPDVYCLSDGDESPAGIETVAYPDFRADDAAPAAAPASLAFPAERVVLIAFTSGSTGAPQAHSKRWGTFVAEARAAALALALAPNAGCALLATVPPQHMYGFIAGIVLPLQLGVPFCAERPFYPEDIRRALARLDRPTVLVTTPVHIRACVLAGMALPNLAFMLSSTAPLPDEWAAQAQALCATRVLEFYGSTETGAIAARAAGHTRWRLFDGVSLTPRADGVEVISEYFPRVVLQDYVERYDAREFVLLGRGTDVVKVAGKRISLADLNRHLLAVEGVVDGVYFAPPAEAEVHARLAAFVVAPGKTREEILQALRARVDPVFLPRPLHIVPALPRNATGKLPRAQLEALFRCAAGA